MVIRYVLHLLPTRAENVEEKRYEVFSWLFSPRDQRLRQMCFEDFAAIFKGASLFHS